MFIITIVASLIVLRLLLYIPTATSDMISEAITSLKDPNGSTQPATQVQQTASTKFQQNSVRSIEEIREI